MEAVILLAHGAPESLDDVEPYVLRIRHGRPLEAALMEQIRERYRLIGGSPLLLWTQRQAAGLQSLLQDRKVYFGMRYSSPLIRETVDQMIADGVRSVRAICLAPQFSAFTIGAYQKALNEAIADRDLQFEMVRSYATHPQLIRAFAAKLQNTLQKHPGAFVLFTAHSLPARALAEADPYDYQAKQTAVHVAKACGLNDWRFAYQSQGMTAERWLEPAVEARLSELSVKSISKAVIMPVGFVCDHVEVLYDIDIYFRQLAAKNGIELFRAESLNDSSEFLELLRQLSAS